MDMLVDVGVVVVGGGGYVVADVDGDRMTFGVVAVDFVGNWEVVHDQTCCFCNCLLK